MVKVADTTALLLKPVFAPIALRRSRAESFVSIVFRDPRIVNVGIEPHVNGAPVGGNIVYGNRTDGQLRRSVDISAARRISHKKSVSSGAAGAPLESNAR